MNNTRQESHHLCSHTHYIRIQHFNSSDLLFQNNSTYEHNNIETYKVLCSRQYTITSLQTAFVFILIKHSDLTELSSL